MHFKHWSPTCRAPIRLERALLVLRLLSNRYSSLLVSSWTGSRPAQIDWSPKRPTLGKGCRLNSALQWSLRVRLPDGRGDSLATERGGAKGGGGGGMGVAAMWLAEVWEESSSMLSSSRSSSSHRSEKSRALRRSRGACFTREDQVVSRREDSASFIGYSWWFTFEALEDSKCAKRCLRGKTCSFSSPNKHNDKISSLNILQSLTEMVLPQ